MRLESTTRKILQKTQTYGRLKHQRVTEEIKEGIKK